MWIGNIGVLVCCFFLDLSIPEIYNEMEGPLFFYISRNMYRKGGKLLFTCHFDFNVHTALIKIRQCSVSSVQVPKDRHISLSPEMTLPSRSISCSKCNIFLFPMYL